MSRKDPFPLERVNGVVTRKSQKELEQWIRDTPISLSGIFLEGERARIRKKLLP